MFNETVINGDASDFRLIGPAAQNGKASFGNVLPILDLDLNTVGYDVAVLVEPDSNGALSLGIKGTSDIKDLEDNGFSGFVDASESYYIDNAPPVLTVTTASPALRAFDFEVLNEPKPGHATLSPFFAALVTVSKKAPMVFSASVLVTPAALATASISSALVIPDTSGYRYSRVVLTL